MNVLFSKNYYQFFFIFFPAFNILLVVAHLTSQHEITHLPKKGDDSLVLTLQAKLKLIYPGEWLVHWRMKWLMCSRVLKTLVILKLAKLVGRVELVQLFIRPRTKLDTIVKSQKYLTLRSVMNVSWSRKSTDGV